MLIKRISSIILISLLSIFSITGCKQVDVKEESKEENNITIEEQIQEFDIEALEYEYITINETIEHVLTVVSMNEELGIQEAIELIRYVQNNRIETTQMLTGQYNDLLDELIDLGIEYVMSSGDKKLELEDKILSVIREMDDLSKKIEETINDFNTL